MRNWLRDAVVYEIYPQSFYDSNKDGIGDLRGIIEKLDYIYEMGFNAIWLNPINKSSFRDAGYDVTDFYSVDERYGSNDDYRELCDKAHERGIKVIFDLVAGHTSIDHPWFKESAKITKNKYSNRYIWTDSALDGSPGISALGERDGKYINNFFWCQPALNYGYACPNPKNPWELPVTHPDCIATKEELKNIIAFWADLGTDAFRVDMASSLIKRDTNGTETVKFWHEIRDFMQNKNPDLLLISEWGYPDKAINAGFHLDFLLHFGPSAYTSLFRHEKGRNTNLDFIGHSFFSKDGKGNINEFLDRFMYDIDTVRDKGYVGLITGNHDMQRIGYGRSTEEIKTVMAFIFTMPAVPFVYYGDEIGMDYIEGLPSKEGGYIRTGSRTPMQWNSEKNHGFSESDSPYLPTDQRDGAPTVENQKNDKSSILNFVKELIRLRRENEAFAPDSEFNVVLPSYPLVYERAAGGKRFFIAINPSDTCRYHKPQKFKSVLFSQNTEIKDGLLKMSGVSFIIAEKE